MGFVENLENAIADPDTYNDERAETAFWLLFKECEGDPEQGKKQDAALKLVQEHRPELARKIAAQILEAATK